MSADHLKLSRRNFGRLAAASALLKTSFASAQNSNRIHCYIDQSGNPSEKNYWLGLLISENPTKHIHDITQLKLKHKYTRQLMYRTTDKFKLKFCNDVIDYFTLEPGLRFYSAHIFLNEWPDDADQRDVVYYGSHRRLLANSPLSSASTVRIHVENRVLKAGSEGKGFRSTAAKFIERLESNFQDVQVVRGFGAGYPLMQVTDFFTGSARNNSNSKNKLLLIDHLRNNLKVPRLDEEHLRSSNKFQIRSFSI